MAWDCLLALTAAVLLQGLAAETPEENTGAMFVTQQAAHAVLSRPRRYNSNHIEELIQTANLERECKEETCSFEEAREVFEDFEKTMEFWVGYIDGDQCKPNPCQNEGSCQDGMGSYVCWCQSNFGGKNCEIEVTKQCSINNGGCSHFCTMQGEAPGCRCAAGYSLGSDKRSCEPTGLYSCGQVNLSPRSTGSLLKPRAANSTKHTERSFNSSEILEEDYDFENMTQYDYDLPAVDSDSVSAPAERVRSVRSDAGPSAAPSKSTINLGDPNITDSPEAKLLAWGFPTLPTITAKENTDQRIVGGNEATPGEISWQVALMSHSDSLGRAQPFCGGSLLSELWVITAAHCLVLNGIQEKGFFVRAGEHDVNKDEGVERDYLVAEQHMHPMYDIEKSPYNHDIALLKLATPVELSNHRRPICLGPKDFTESLLRDSSTSLVSGWGRLASLGPLASKLRRLEVPYVERTDCKLSSSFQITRFMFCAGYKNEQRDSCQGDSGGPHATNYNGTWFLTGIVSWGEECAKKGKYGIYTRVSRYYSWLSRITGLQSTD